MKKTKEDSVITRDSILQAALVVFSENGYAATRLEDIAQAANVTRGAIYWHFKNKFDLLYNLVKDFRTGFQDELMSVINKHNKPETILYNAMMFIFKCTENEGEFLKFEQLSSIIRELPENSEKIINELKNQKNEFHDKIEAVFKELLLSGKYNQTYTPDFLTRIYSGYIKGILLTWSEDKWFGEKKILPWMDAEKLTNFFLSALKL